MPNLRKTDVVAIAISDLHLSTRPPRCYKEMPEYTWRGMMGAYLDELREATIQNNDCPLLIAGDIFDIARPPLSLVNWSMREFSKFPGDILIIPGQHDLPSHDIDSRHNVAYGTLCELANVRDITDEWHGVKLRDRNCYVHPAGWGKEFQKAVPSPMGNPTNIGIIHRYLWNANAKHAMAEDKDDVSQWSKKNVPDYLSVVISGDNHSKWRHEDDRGIQYVNNGSMMVRSKNQVAENFIPRYTEIDNKGGVETFQFKAHGLVYEWLQDLSDIECKKPDPIGATEHMGLISELRSVGADPTDIEMVIDLATKSAALSESCRKLIKRIVDDCK